VTEVPLGLRFVVWLTESFGRFTTTDVVVAGTALDETAPLFPLVTVAMLVVVLVCEPAAVVETVVDSIAPCVVLVTLEVVVEISPSEFEVELELAQLLIATANSTDATSFIAQILPIRYSLVDW
jgi:hypothetical protein